MKKRNLAAICGSASCGKKFRLPPSAFCLSATAGFTLIEALVALIIVAITVSVVLGSQLHSLKIEQKARALQVFRLETQRIFSVTHRAANETQLIELLSTGRLCRVKSEPVRIEAGTNVLTLIKHELSVEALPAFSSVFYTRIPDYPCQRSAVGGNSVKEQKPPVVP